MRTAALALLVAACQPPDPGAIEITGYLDASRVTFGADGADALAIGRDGAAFLGGNATFRDLTSGAADDGVVADDGSFLREVAAATGDVLELGVAVGEVSDVITYVAVDLAPFPTTLHVSVHADPHDPHQALVDVQFDPPRHDGEVWASADATGAVAVLDVFDLGATHTGTIAAAEADTVVLTWVPTDGDASAGLAVAVGPVP